MVKKYTYDEVYQSTLKYFNGDELAAKVWIGKYSLKDSDGNIYELNPHEMHQRLASEFERIEMKYNNPLFGEEIMELLEDFKYVVPQGGPMSGIGNNLQTVSISNCFVVGNEYDSYGGLIKTDEEQVQLMKRRGGVGHDLSHIRPKGSPVKNSALTSTGIVPFMERYSNSTREVAQDGRRGALMLSVAIKHPDSIDFVNAKMEEGKVTGANISLRIDDEFMHAVKDNKSYRQQFPIKSDNPSIIKNVNAKDFWKKIVHNAWKSAEPGILFWDTIIKESVPDCYDKYGYGTTSTNPCFTGDTIVAVADGRNGVSIKSLSEQNERFLVYSARQSESDKYRKNGKWITEIKEAIAFKTGTKSIIEVFLSDGTSFRCTPDHQLALSNKDYICAKDSIGKELGKFYTYSNKSTNKSYRHINSKTYHRQHSMIWDYLYEPYNSKEYNIHHVDGNSTNDLISNLELIGVKEHISETNHDGLANPVWKVPAEYRSIINKKRNILANATRYKWSEERKQSALDEYYTKYGDIINKYQSDKESLNICLNEPIYVIDIKDAGTEDVYDLTVEDNHNFYIITKSDDDKYLNCSGILVHNCGEIPLCPYDSCRLIAINLYNYVVNPFTSSAYFNFELFKIHVRRAMKMMDDIIDIELEKIEAILSKIETDPEPEESKIVERSLWMKIKEKAELGRRTGLGTTGEGDMLAALGLTYGTDEGNDFSELVHKTLAIAGYESSIDMAQERGAFPIYDKELEKNNPFVNRIYNELSDEYKKKFDLYGRRNIALFTLAPTGTTSICTRTTSGIEPVFLVNYKRRKKINPNDKDSRVDFVDETGDKFQEFNVFHHHFITWATINGYDISQLEKMSSTELQEVINKSPYYKATSNDVDWIKKVELQGRIQKWIDHSISVTVNLPNNVTEELVSQVYMKGWECGCKGITIYRDGSRSGVLISNDTKKKVGDEDFMSTNAPKRPKSLEAHYYVVSAKGKKYGIVVGIYKDRPYEIFAFTNPKHLENCIGTITKVKKGQYRFECQNFVMDNVELASELIEERAHTLMLSMLLRHRAPIEHIINVAKKIDDNITSFSSAVRRVLSKYLKETELEHEKCPECGGKLIKTDGCIKCENTLPGGEKVCTYSKCG